VIIIVKKCSSC